MRYAFLPLITDDFFPSALTSSTLNVEPRFDRGTCERFSGFLKDIVSANGSKNECAIVCNMKCPSIMNGQTSLPDIGVLYSFHLFRTEGGMPRVLEEKRHLFVKHLRNGY